jgi:hypothetical protein
MIHFVCMCMQTMDIYLCIPEFYSCMYENLEVAK